MIITTNVWELIALIAVCVCGGFSFGYSMGWCKKL